MIYISIILLSVFIIFIISSYNKLFKLNLENISTDNRKIHSQPVNRYGGLSILSILLLLFFIEDETIRITISFSILIFLIGFLEDIFFDIAVKIRFLLSFIFITLFVILSNLIINDFNNFFLNYIFQQSIFLFFGFSILGLVILINGFNFIDGNNGLLIGYSMLALIFFVILSFLNAKIQDTQLIILCLSLICAILPLLFINAIKGKILAGDGGSYILGFLIGSIGILISNEYLIDPSLIACVLFYPVMEVLFSFLRRLISNKNNPFKPDSFHLHTLLYEILLNNFNKKSISNKNFLNSMTSFIILFFYTVLIIFSYFLYGFFTGLNIFIGLCLIYVLIYIFVRRYHSNLNSN